MLILYQGLLDKVEHGLWEALSSGAWLSWTHVNIFFSISFLNCAQRNLIRLYFSNKTL